jgi:hypothetical protein
MTRRIVFGLVAQIAAVPRQPPTCGRGPASRAQAWISTKGLCSPRSTRPAPRARRATSGGRRRAACRPTGAASTTAAGADRAVRVNTWLASDWGVPAGLHVVCPVPAWSRVRVAVDERAETRPSRPTGCGDALRESPRSIGHGSPCRPAMETVESTHWADGHRCPPAAAGQKACPRRPLTHHPSTRTVRPHSGSQNRQTV